MAPRELSHYMTDIVRGDLVPVDPSAVTGKAAEGHALLDLNNARATELSWLEPLRLRHLVRQAFLARRDALLLALDQEADYDSPNFLWFQPRYERFVYVDRIVAAAGCRGRGYARRLYGNLFDHATRAGHGRVVCEVNSDPPNPGSDAFHANLRFRQVGSGRVHGGATSVRYRARRLTG